jgi:hypothetical protein
MKPALAGASFVLIITVMDFTAFCSCGDFILDLQLSGNHRQRSKNFIGHYSPPVREIAPHTRNGVRA